MYCIFVSNTYGFYQISQIQSIINVFNTTNNILYLLLFCIIIYLYKSHCQIIMTIYIWYIFLVVLLYYYTLNPNLFALLDNQSGLNLNLTNGILLLHPPLLYYFYALIFITIFIFFGSKPWFIARIKQTNNKRYNLLYTLLYLVPLLLGCWWAEQELLWGG